MEPINIVMLLILTIAMIAMSVYITYQVATDN